ncbi:TraB/GumN family protein [Curvibacter sp. APW13]|uniref:TraB/GumN family protein n=1 Tax=Curvibacter sp. APW13 TaxID=3077236 RepID=UPI0028DEBBB5|nr:TraB/GumN family protein [Curvibacter sp. APW13]MDT8991974.1 TraB/GumN family protein [Curvibacter sp. APW13]
MIRVVLHVLLWCLAAFAAWAQPPVPLLWKVSDADNSVYLLGSMHMLTKDDYPLAPVVEAAFDDSSKLVFEVAPQGMDPARVAPLMLQVGTRRDGKSLQQALPPATWKALEAYAASRGMQSYALQQFKPWFVALMIISAESMRVGLDPAQGLDQHFMARAAAAGKATDGLESAESQIALFDRLGPKAELEFLQETLADLPRFQAQMDELLQAWRQADEATIERIGLHELRRDYPALYQSINVARNRAWLTLVQAMLRQPGPDNTLVVVGAMHLLGRDGLVQQLRQRGLRVERLR